MKNLMKVIYFLIVFSLVSTAVVINAEDTSDDPENSTYSNDRGSFTYYDLDGNPLPPGTRIFLGLDGRGGSLMDDEGHSTGEMGFDTRERAEAARRAIENNRNDVSCISPTNCTGVNLDIFDKPNIENACLLDPDSEACKLETKELLAIESKTMAQDAADGKLACGYDKNVEVLNLSAGVNNLSLASSAATVSNNPNSAVSVGPSADSQSANMILASSALGASIMSANERTATQADLNLTEKCALVEKLTPDQLKGQEQMYAQACIIQKLLNGIVALFKDSDSLAQQLIEMQAALNQALAENLKRDEQIKKEKDDLKAVNKEITDAIKKLKDAKEKQKAAKKKSEDAAKKAADTPCKPGAPADPNDPNSVPTPADCKDHDKAAEEAAKAKEELDAANKELEKAVKEVVTLLIKKMGNETKAVLALLNGTIHGEAGSDNVQFKVLGTDFTLTDLGKAISQATGATGPAALAFLDDSGKNKQKATIAYFDDLIKNEQRSISGTPGRIPSPALNDKAEDEIITRLASGDSGIQNLETFVVAVSNYKADTTAKKITYLESLKTPQARVKLFEKEIYTRKQFTGKINQMLEKSICYLEVNLATFKVFYKEAFQGSNKAPNLLFTFLNSFPIEKLKEKLKDGYFSRVNIKAIKREFLCSADNQPLSSCKIPEEGAPPSKPPVCSWAAIVAGPETGLVEPTVKCEVNGQHAQSGGHTWVCSCRNQ